MLHNPPKFASFYTFHHILVNRGHYNGPHITVYAVYISMIFLCVRLPTNLKKKGSVTLK